MGGKQIEDSVLVANEVVDNVFRRERKDRCLSLILRNEKTYNSQLARVRGRFGAE